MHRPLPHGALPAGVVSCYARALPARFSLMPAELDAVAGMAARRRAEFELGRYCAREALSLLGRPARALPVGPGRAPLWPAGIAGSIAHSGGAAVAVASEHHAGVGVDIEQRASLEPDLVAMICRDDELGDGTREDTGTRAARLFAAKEAVYKCQWPLTKLFLEFHDVEVCLDDDRPEFTARFHHHDGLEPLAARLRGRCGFFDGLILATAWLDAAPGP